MGLAHKQMANGIGNSGSCDVDFRKLSQLLQIDKHMDPSETLVKEAPTRWADLCADKLDEGSIGE